MSTTTKKQEAPAAIPPESAIAKKESVNPAALVPLGDRGIMLRTLDDLLKLAKHFVDNGAAPKDMTAGAAAIAIQAGLERGLSITSGLQFGTVINGKFGWNGQGVLALIQNSPACKPGTLDHGVEGEGEKRHGWCVAHRVGYEEPFRHEFSVADARTAGLVPGKPESPWTKYRDGQLVWRAVGIMGKFRFSDVLGGFPMDFELRDHPEMTARVVSPPGERRALPPPVDDPLNELIFGGKRPAAEPVIIEVEAVREAASKIPQDRLDAMEMMTAEPSQVSAEPSQVSEREPGEDEDPPFASHEEADRELAEQEAKQAGLFDTRKESRLR